MEAKSCNLNCKEEIFMLTLFDELINLLVWSSVTATTVFFVFVLKDKRKQEKLSRKGGNSNFREIYLLIAIAFFISQIQLAVLIPSLPKQYSEITLDSITFLILDICYMVTLYYIHIIRRKEDKLIEQRNRNKKAEEKVIFEKTRSR
jgi:hypothetical protein